MGVTSVPGPWKVVGADLAPSEPRKMLDSRGFVKQRSGDWVILVWGNLGTPKKIRGGGRVSWSIYIGPCVFRLFIPRRFINKLAQSGIGGIARRVCMHTCWCTKEVATRIYRRQESRSIVDAPTPEQLGVVLVLGRARPLMFAVPRAEASLEIPHRRLHVLPHSD